jgi:hypothetical protein
MLISDLVAGVRGVDIIHGYKEIKLSVKLIFSTKMISAASRPLTMVCSVGLGEISTFSDLTAEERISVPAVQFRF